MKETLKSLKGGCIWFFELVFRKLLFVSWYIVLLWLSVDYCINNWEKVTSFTPFSGHSLIFVYMLALSIMPFVKKIGFRDVFIEFAEYIQSKKLEAVAEEKIEQVKELERNKKTPRSKGGKNV